MTSTPIPYCALLHNYMMPAQLSTMNSLHMTTSPVTVRYTSVEANVVRSAVAGE